MPINQKAIYKTRPGPDFATTHNTRGMFLLAIEILLMRLRLAIEAGRQSLIDGAAKILDLSWNFHGALSDI
jgi:hypothetical protein